MAMDRVATRLYGASGMHNRRPAAPHPRLSVVIPTYNRRAILPAAIDSALAWLDALGQGEILVVDDASTDGTEQAVRSAYAGRIERGQLSFHRLAQNRGVTGAKNEGARLARGDWLLFLDSDDRLIAEAAAPAMAAMDGAPSDAPLIFFRCIDETDQRLLGRQEGAPRRLDIRTHIAGWQWGECLPAVRALAWRLHPYEEELRGYEGIAYGRMIRTEGNALLSDIVARSYDQTGIDRLTTSASRRRHACLHARGTWLMAREFGQAMPVLLKLAYLRSALWLSAQCAWRRLTGRA